MFQNVFIVTSIIIWICIKKFGGNKRDLIFDSMSFEWLYTDIIDIGTKTDEFTVLSCKLGHKLLLTLIL